MNYGWEGMMVKLHEYVHLWANQSIKHDKMCFPAIFQLLQWEAKSTKSAKLNIYFFDVKGVLIQTIVQKTVASKDRFQKMSVSIPKNLMGKVGSFSIQNSEKRSIVTIDNVSLH
jgi:hypothetical protein